MKDKELPHSISGFWSAAIRLSSVYALIRFTFKMENHRMRNFCALFQFSGVVDNSFSSVLHCKAILNSSQRSIVFFYIFRRKFCKL